MQIFTALADPTRQHIVELLARNGQMAVAELRVPFDISAPAISQHLKVLREARLVRAEVRAQQRLYSLDPVGIGEMETWVAKLHQHWSERFDALDEVLKQEMKTSKRRKKEGKK